MAGVLQAEFRHSVPSRSSRAIATVRASRMLWAEGMRVAVSTCRFGRMFLVRGPEPRDLRFGEFLLVTGQRAQVGAVRVIWRDGATGFLITLGEALPLDIGDKGPLVE